jgi:hypothetical protein
MGASDSNFGREPQALDGSKFDVQFNNLDARYLFGFAGFDDAQVQHAMGDEPLTLVFTK